VIFYEGGLGYTEACNLPLPRLKRLHDKASKVSHKRAAEAEAIRTQAGIK